MPSESVVIVGGGIIGLCSALELARHGYRVTVLERSPAAQGCSFGNAGMIVPSHFIPLAAPGMIALGLRWMWNPESPFAIHPWNSASMPAWCWRFWRACTPARVAAAAPVLRDLNLASRAAYERLADAAGSEFQLARRGLLMLCHSERALHHEAQVAEQARTLGVPAEVLAPADLLRVDPSITMQAAGGVLFPMDCHLSPQDFMAWITRRLEKLGVNLQFAATVTGFRHSGQRMSAVIAGTAEYPADHVVLASGVWSAELAQQLELTLPLQPGKGYSLTLPHPPQRPQLCSILTEARVAVTPMGTALRFAGAMELGSHGTHLNPRRIHGIIKAVSRYFPAFREADFAGITPWSGLRPCSPDGLPYLGRPRRWSNLVVAAGHAMMGLSLGPVTGELVAQLVGRTSSKIDLTLLHPDRYA